MGMTGGFAAISNEDLQAIVENPQRAISLVELEIADVKGVLEDYLKDLKADIDDPKILPEQRQLYQTAYEQGAAQKANIPDSNNSWKLSRGCKMLDIDKTWNAIHILLTLDEPDGSPLEFILSGGTIIETEDFGYGPPRAFTPEQVIQINNALSKIDPATLVSMDNLRRMEKEHEDIYCFSVSEDELDYIDHYLRDLIAFVAAAAKAKQALIAYLA